MRPVLHLTTGDIVDLAGELVAQPEAFRVVAFGPMGRGELPAGPRLVKLRQLLRSLGRVRASGTADRIYLDVDRGHPDWPPLVALTMIARSDAAGLERAILSCLPFVDEIVIGIDQRSDTETRQVAEAYADAVCTFGPAELGLTEEEFAADRIDFSKARNLVLEHTRAAWALVLDTDEYMREAVDFRPVLASAPEDVGAFEVAVVEVSRARGEFRHGNFQRLARSEFRWWSQTHNQLAARGKIDDTSIKAVIAGDLKLRSAEEQRRRAEQRNVGVEQLRAEADKGEVQALYHLAMHLVGKGENEGAKLAEEYRLRLEVAGPAADQRAYLAMCCAAMFYNRDDLDRADMWATRVLLDGARPEALCLKGDICEDRGDLAGALAWYDCACVVEDVGTFQWGHVTVHKHNRRAGLRLALGLPLAA